MNEMLVEMLPITLDLSAMGEMTEDQFFQFCQDNEGLDFEREANGTIIIKAPTFSDTGQKNADIITDLGNWNRKTKLGVVFDSNAGFTFLNRAMRSPDSAWISIQRWQLLSKEEKRKFAHISPDFVVELSSYSNSTAVLHSKMKEYITNGVRLAWLIQPDEEKLTIYRVDGSLDVIDGFDNVASGEDVLPGFVFELSILR